LSKHNRISKILREGESNGDGWLLELSSSTGRKIFAVAVAQKNRRSRTGPTWSYVFENNGWTSIDLGTPGSYEALKDGYSTIGINPSNIERVIISHGHSDHDGTVTQFLDDSSAELWAHQSYGPLKQYIPWEIHYRKGSILQKELERIAEEKIQITNENDNDWRDTDKKYFEDRKRTQVSKDLKDGDIFTDLKVMSTPGHSPDQICLVLDDLIFTGDHILPEITPHPTSKMVFRDSISKNLPEFLKDPSGLYGLGAYLNSLGRVIELGDSYTVLPAHRLYNKSNFNWHGVERAGDILKHHEKRLDQMLKKLQGKTSNLEETTKGIFERSKLLGSNLYAAMSEIVAHLELLEDTEDILIDESGQISMQGDGTNYKNYISKLLDPK